MFPAGRVDASWVDALYNENASLSFEERQRLRRLIVRTTASDTVSVGPSGGCHGRGPVSHRLFRRPTLQGAVAHHWFNFRHIHGCPSISSRKYTGLACLETALEETGTSLQASWIGEH
ncbi:unnamed protein product [Lampetra fluviatilis]